MGKFTEDDLKKELETKEYEYGFYTDIESDTFPVGLSEDVVRAISKKKEEPEWMTQWRLEAFRSWEEMTEPEWANVHYQKPDFQAISYYSAPNNKPKYDSIDDVDPELLDTFIEISPRPQHRETTSRLVEPEEKNFSGFVFKIHANLDPRHRDRTKPSNNSSR